jgi:hypothetical protein
VSWWSVSFASRDSWFRFHWGATVGKTRRERRTWRNSSANLRHEGRQRTDAESRWRLEDSVHGDSWQRQRRRPVENIPRRSWTHKGAIVFGRSGCLWRVDFAVCNVMDWLFTVDASWRTWSIQFRGNFEFVQFGIVTTSSSTVVYPRTICIPGYPRIVCIIWTDCRSHCARVLSPCCVFHSDLNFSVSSRHSSNQSPSPSPAP